MCKRFGVKAGFGEKHLGVGKLVDSGRLDTDVSEPCFGQDRADDDAVREAKMHAEGWIVRYVTDAQARNARALGNSVRALVSARQAA